MRDERRFLSGRKITTPPRHVPGRGGEPLRAALSISAPIRLAKKIAAGAQFMPDAILLRRAAARALHAAACATWACDERCFILVGVGPLASARTAKWMRANVPGVHIPDDVIARLEGAQNQKAEGKRICIEMIQQIREIEGVAGVHVMAYRQEEYVSEIVARVRRAARPHAVAARLPAEHAGGREPRRLRAAE